MTRSGFTRSTAAIFGLDPREENATGPVSAILVEGDGVVLRVGKPFQNIDGRQDGKGPASGRGAVSPLVLASRGQNVRCELMAGDVENPQFGNLQERSGIQGFRGRMSHDDFNSEVGRLVGFGPAVALDVIGGVSLVGRVAEPSRQEPCG